MNLLKLLRTNWPFWIPYCLFLMGLGTAQLLYRQGIISLEVNRYSNPYADLFFKYITHLGDGAFVIAAGLVMLYRSRYKGILILLSYAVSGIFAQLIKNFGFPKEPRPAEYFSGMMQHLHTVEGVELSHWNSFPSGHTTSAFAFFALITFWVKSPFLKFLCLAAAVTVGFSRMYLMQHFLIDVYAGSLLGTLTAYALVLNSHRLKLRAST
ncbi:phosphatase PAP2 family protein [Runella slithyformis]|uniref:Phosphoesterase PA-phosphatase related protein n=1 Tax=Runella slithyformis (strain ATCC 29530 / DSM 19594 / LMG 11500 / NCIMB 11436 / LSU 4) TaxID=761193 RepID=A0A7U3ZLY1_RUNSL|nr:phosphatase PAP2 family protein [Runella slithyformis]AEI49620.1 phosphoesterase PA-phosphatase related protein [Runella slithyformis DSM 19594]